MQSLGKSVFRFKLERVRASRRRWRRSPAACLSAFLQLATPSLFGFSISLTIFAMVILGGMGNLTGSVIGAAPARRRWTRSSPASIGLSADKAGFVQFIVYGLLLVRAHARCARRACCPRASRSLRWARRQQQPLAGRVEMVRAEGWVPNGERRASPSWPGPSTSSSRRRRP